MEGKKIRMDECMHVCMGWGDHNGHWSVKPSGIELGLNLAGR